MRAPCRAALRACLPARTFLRPRPHGGSRPGKGGHKVDRQQFSQMVTQYERLVYTVCFQLVRDAQLAEDLAQETFLSAWIHRDDCPPDSYKPWLARIAANKAKDHLKSAYRRRVQPDDGQTGPMAFMADARAGPEDIALTRDEAARARDAILALREPYHQVAVRHFLQGQPVEEIARALGRPPKTVHTQLYRAKQMLQTSLKEGGTRHGT